MRRSVRLAPLALLLVVDVMLLAWLVRWVDDHQVSAGSSSSATTSSSPGPTGDAPVATGRVSVVGSGSAILRLTEGACTGEGRPVLELSTDVGRTFDETAVPVLEAPDGTTSAPRTLLAARATSPTAINVVAGDLDCVARGYATADGGASWVEAPYGDWYVDASRTSVVRPDGQPVEPGCPVTTLSVVSEQNVKILCDDATIRGTNDSGETWDVLGGLEGITALTMTARFDGIGVAARPECASQVLVTGDAGGSWDVVGCVDPSVTITHLTRTADQVVAATDTQVWTSSDGGATWVPVAPDA